MTERTRRRIYLMRHGAVAYFDDTGRPVAPETVPLTDEGRTQAETARQLLAWEVLGNCKWAIGALNQSRRHLQREERSVELAILGRLAAEMELELLDLIEKAA